MKRVYPRDRAGVKALVERSFDLHVWVGGKVIRRHLDSHCTGKQFTNGILRARHHAR